MLTVFGCSIKPQGWKCSEPNRRAVLYKMPASRLVLVAEEASSLLRDVYRSPEVDFKHRTGKVIRSPFCFAGNSVAGVVEYDVDTSEGVLGPLESLLYLVMIGDVKLDEDELRLGVIGCERLEYCRLAQSGDDSIDMSQSTASHLEAETRRCPSDYENSLTISDFSRNAKTL